MSSENPISVDAEVPDEPGFWTREGVSYFVEFDPDGISGIRFVEGGWCRFVNCYHLPRHGWRKADDVASLHQQVAELTRERDEAQDFERQLAVSLDALDVDAPVPSREELLSAANEMRQGFDAVLAAKEAAEARVAELEGQLKEKTQ